MALIHAVLSLLLERVVYNVN